jgi:hypothetical protein
MNLITGRCGFARKRAAGKEAQICWAANFLCWNNESAVLLPGRALNTPYSLGGFEYKWPNNSWLLFRFIWRANSGNALQPSSHAPRMPVEHYR